ncbi:MAG: hypothetical protein WCF08_08000 [Anaerolineaceae bacterium]
MNKRPDSQLSNGIKSSLPEGWFAYVHSRNADANMVGELMSCLKGNPQIDNDR